MRATMAALMVASLPFSAAADDHPVVVELFTSQGCSSCPPADAMLGELAAMPGVIALALHVDYWDYIGWSDTFAHAAFTGRQESYARAVGERTIYTPQFIVGGVDQIAGADAMAVMDHLRRHAGAETKVRLDVLREGDRLRITGVTESELPPVTVELVRFMPAETVDIAHGENAGHRIDYVNIVTAWETVGEWGGAEPLQLDLTVTGEEPVVVILQEIGPGRIVAADVVR